MRYSNHNPDRFIAFERASAFIGAAEACDSMDRLVGAMASAIAPLGACRFARVAFMRPDTEPSIGPLVGSFDPAWVTHYVEQGFAAHDIVLEAALETTAPKRWAEWARRAPSRETREVFAAAASFGSKDGLSIPVHHWRGAAAAIVMVGEQIDDAPEAQSFLHLVGIHFNTALERLAAAALPEPDRRTLLTARQTECLRWVAAGKSDWEIGEILGLSAHTIHRHVERAKIRLDVRTRTQAVMAIFGGPTRLHL